jgi:hypothetical protein
MASTTGGGAIETSARDTVFALPELFEAILLELPWKDILKVTPICQHWNTTIKKSPQIRKKLHAPTKSANAAKPAWALEAVLSLPAPVYSHHIKLNPYLNVPTLSQSITSARLANKPMQGVDKLIFQLTNEMLAIADRSSCLAMHLTDPPCTTMVFTPIGDAAIVGSLPGYYTFTIYEPDGITYGQAIKKVTTICRTIRVVSPYTASTQTRPGLFYHGVVFAPPAGGEKLAVLHTATSV